MTDDPTARIGIADVLENCSRILGKRLLVPTPDAVSSAAGPITWNHFQNWEQRSDVEIAASSGLLGISFDGPLFIVTEAALTQGQGAFVVPAADDLERFVGGHLTRFGECFFNGDVLIVDAGIHIWMFHHEGVYATVRRPVPT